MKSKIQIHPIPYGTQDWHDFRINGIGGSECGAILKLNPYETAARVFHEKIQNLEPQTEDTQFMFWGREHEDKIAEIWSYWDGTPEGYIENKKAGKIIRKCRNVNGYAVNPDYPWLLTGEPLKEEGILECKTLSYWGASVWADGIPPYYLTQIQQYMLIFEVNYAEIAILTDGNKFHVEYIKRDDNLCQQIIDITRSWWYDRVVPAREAREKRDIYQAEGNIKQAEAKEAIIQQLEPEPDDTEAYRQFQSDKFLKEREEVEGDFEVFDLCKQDEILKKLAGRIKKERDLIKNTLIKWIVEMGAELASFDKLGKFTYTLKKGAKNRSLLVSIKEKPDEGRVEEEFKKLNLEY